MSSLVFIPTGGSGWTNSNNIITEDAAYASSLASPKRDTLNLLSTLSLASLPDTAVVNGLQVEVKGYSPSSGSYGYGTARPSFEFNDGSSLLKTHASIMTNTNAWYVFGGPTDLWGQASILPSRLKNVSAQWRFRAYNNSSASLEQVYVDFIRVTVYYTNNNISPMALSFCF